VRVAVVGQGSIGRRHAEIALALGHELVVYDPSPTVRAPPGALAARSARECIQGAGAAVVASPSSEHVADARVALELGVPVLVEKPLALNCAQAAELDWLARERGTMLSVAMNLREHPGVQALGALIAEDAVGSILRVSAWCGSWLPGWRPRSDYRDSYSARKERGGGVLLDVAVHELDYLLWLIGPARSVSALARRVSGLETDVEDVASISIELARGGIVELSVDYLDRAYTRGCRIVGSTGTLHWSWENQSLTQHDPSGAVRRQALPSDVAPTYRRQLERFLRAVRDGAPAPVPAASAQQVLAVIDAARISSSDGRRIALAPALTLRPVRAEDAACLLAWRNDPDTRHQSRASHEITPSEHASWLRRTLGDVSIQAWMVECEGHGVANARVEVEGDGVAEVHITVAPRARGRGFGAAALLQASARALADPGTTLLCAHVKPDNQASLRMFARAGFHVAGSEADGLVRLERSFGAT
jgi:predicted dehydrogenase/RimJ/RimL family protein N-acetyltransferase